MAASMRSSKQSMSPSKMKIARKRKSDQLGGNDDSEDDVTEKRLAMESYSVAEFRVQMKDPNTIFQALEKFCKLARAFPESSAFDIVDEYCQSSPECKEVFAVFETGRRKPAEIRTLLETFEAILLRVADDLNKHKAVGKFIVRRLLTSHISTIYFTLNSANNSVQIKSALRTLTAMVLLGTDAANEILLRFNFHHANVPPLLNRRDTKDPQDVRTCYIQFLMSFMVVGDNGIIRQLMEAKGVLNVIFNDMKYEKAVVINMVLQTLKEKVVENPTITKTLKVRVFSERTLNELANVYQWVGPSAWLTDRKNKNKPTSPETPVMGVGNPEYSEDRNNVRELLHEFLVGLCCSLKMGINFLDRTLGTSKNKNPLLTDMLVKMKSAASDDLMGKLVVEVLQVCPDLLVWYLPSLKESLRPRPSLPWQKTIRLLQKIFTNQSTVCPALTLQVEVTRTTLLKMVMNTLLPMKDVWQQVNATLENDSHSVKYEGLQMILIVLQRLKASLEYCSQPHSTYTLQELAELKLFMVHSLRQLLPDVKNLVKCWNSAFIRSKTQPKTTDVGDTDISEGFEAVSETKYLVSLLQVLCAYQTTLPEVFREHTIDFGALLEGVRTKVLGKQQSDEDGDAEDITMLQLCLLQLLAHSDVRQFSWTKESVSLKTTLYLLFEMTVTIAKEDQFSDAAVILLIKLLLGTGTFNNLEAELRIWIQHLIKQEDSGTSQVIEFLEKAMLKVFKDPYLYTEKVIDAGAVVSQAGTGGMPLETISDAQFDEIMNEDIDLSKMVDEVQGGEVNSKSGKLPFSPLLPCCLDAMNKGDVPAEVQSYFQNVLKDILWLQVEPEALCILLAENKDGLALSPAVATLVKKWVSSDVTEFMVAGEGKKKEKKPKDVLSIVEQSITDDSVLAKLELHDLKDLPMTQILPLTSRVLLSLRTALMEDCTKEVLKIYSKFVLKIDEKLREGVEHDPDQTNDERLSFLDMDKSDTKWLHTTFYHMILSHPSMKEWFLRSNKGEEEPAGKGFQAKRKTVTGMISGIVASMKKDILPALVTDLDPYRSRLIEAAAANKGKDKIVASCFQNMASIFDAQQLLAVVESVLALKSDVLVTNDSLTDDGQALLMLMQEYLALQSLDSLNTILSQSAFKCILHMASIVSDFDQILEKLISLFPSLVTAVDEKYVCHCFQEGQPGQIAVLRICLQLSPACRLWFQEWATQEKLKMDQLHQYSGLYHQFMASANIEDVRNQKLVKKVSRTIAKDLTGWLESNHGYLDFFKEMLRWSSNDFAEDLFEEMLEVMEEQGSLELFKILQLLNDHIRKSADDQSDKMVMSCIKYMLKLASKKSLHDKSTVQQLLDAVCELLKEKSLSLNEMQGELRKLWPQMTKQFLRHLYQSPNTHVLLAVLAQIVYDGKTPVHPDAKTLHGVVIGNSAFLDMMLDEEKKETACKEKVVLLLLKLVILDKACCDVSHIAVMLGAYSATLTLSDRTILSLVREYEQNGCDMSEYKPYLWGAKATEHHALKQDLSIVLKKQPTMSQVLDGLDADVMLHSIHQFPLTRSYEKMNVSGDDTIDCSTNVYDPLFILPLFAHLLSPGYVSHYMKFMELNCLGYAVAALSSHDNLVRCVAYHVLHLFYQQLEGSRFGNKDMFLYFMKLIRNSIETPGVKLSPIVTIFLAKTAAILIDPQHRLFSAVNSFLLLKPKLDVVNVPEFYKLFNSVEVQHKFERSWMLTLLKDGLRETGDYRIYQRRYIFKLIQSVHDSPLSDIYNQKQVLAVLHQACQLKTVAFDLVKNQALLTWITSLISRGPCSWSLITDLLSSLWFTVLGKRDVATPDVKLKRPCLPVQFTLEMLQVMTHLLMSMRQWMMEENLCKYLHCFTSVLKHLLATRNLALSENKDIDIPKLQLVNTFVSFPFVLRLLLHWSKITKNSVLQQDINSARKQYFEEIVHLSDPEDSQASDETDGKDEQQNANILLVNAVCLLQIELSESENTAEKDALLLSSNWLMSDLLEKPQDPSRWQQFCLWLRHIFSQEWTRLAYLNSHLAEIQMNKLMHFYKTDDQEVRSVLNDIHIALYQTCLKHRTPKNLYDRLSGHFKSAMRDMTKEFAKGNMEELITELVLETKSGASNDGHFKTLLSKY